MVDFGQPLSCLKKIPDLPWFEVIFTEIKLEMMISSAAQFTLRFTIKHLFKLHYTGGKSQSRCHQFRLIYQ